MTKNKSYDFILVLKDSGHQLVNNISKMMLVFTLLAFAYFGYLSYPAIPFGLLFISTAILLWWYFIYIQGRKGKFLYYRIALVFAAGGWYLLPSGKWMALIYLLAAILEKQAKFPREWAFDAEEIVLNSFPRKHFTWAQLHHVVLKDGLLTLDFINNHLVQEHLASTPTQQEEKDFNTFCKTHLVGKD